MMRVRISLHTVHLKAVCNFPVVLLVQTAAVPTGRQDVCCCAGSIPHLGATSAVIGSFIMISIILK